MYCCILFVGLLLVANLYTIGQIGKTVIFSHRRHLQRAVSRMYALKAEGFLNSLKSEVNLITDMVRRGSNSELNSLKESKIGFVGEVPGCVYWKAEPYGRYCGWAGQRGAGEGAPGPGRSSHLIQRCKSTIYHLARHRSPYHC